MGKRERKALVFVLACAAALLAVTGLLFVLVSDGSERVDAPWRPAESSVAANATTIPILVKSMSCNDSPSSSLHELDVDETDEQVEVTAKLDLSYASDVALDCEEGPIEATIALDAAIGSRPLIDGSSGEQVYP